MPKLWRFVNQNQFYGHIHFLFFLLYSHLSPLCNTLLAVTIQMQQYLLATISIFTTIPLCSQQVCTVFRRFCLPQFPTMLNLHGICISYKSKVILWNLHLLAFLCLLLYQYMYWKIIIMSVFCQNHKDKIMLAKQH